MAKQKEITIQKDEIGYFIEFSGAIIRPAFNDLNPQLTVKFVTQAAFHYSYTVVFSDESQDEWYTCNVADIYHLATKVLSEKKLHKYLRLSTGVNLHIAGCGLKSAQSYGIGKILLKAITPEGHRKLTNKLTKLEHKIETKGSEI